MYKINLYPNVQFGFPISCRCPISKCVNDTDATCLPTLMHRDHLS